jgi:valyl-tRNA synthetase
MLAALAAVATEATTAFEAYDYTRALDRAETFFWRFCDDYVELVKGRAYGDGPEAASARAALGLALSTLQRLFAPFLPFATEEVWSWWQEGSVHRAPWPDGAELAAVAGGGDPTILTVTADALGEVRKAKTTAKRSLRTDVTRAVVTDTAERLTALRLAEADLRDAGRIADLVVVEGDSLTVDVELTPPD